MISMPYDLAKLPIQSLLRPISDAGIALARLDERIARSPVGNGWIERSHFTDACASLWIDGELVHLEDLVLHDATKDIRAGRPPAGGMPSIWSVPGNGGSCWTRGSSPNRLHHECRRLRLPLLAS
jgi:hypothetical protein